MVIYLSSLSFFLFFANGFFIIVDKRWRRYWVKGIIRLECLLRFLIEMPFILVYLSFLASTLSEFYSDYYSRVLVNILCLSLMLGYGLHWAADAIDIIQHDYELKGSDVEVKAQRLSYFLDEFLGHKFIYYPLFGLFALLTFREIIIPMTLLETIIVSVSAILFGTFIMLSTIEGQSAIEGLLFALFISMTSTYKLTTKGFNYIITSPIVLFDLLTSITMLVIGIFWYIKFKGFKELSKTYKA